MKTTVSERSVRAIFFDLETSDKNPIGQILNFCFIATEEDFTVRSECCGSISISRLELPHPEAILANRINVERHNDASAHPENAPLMSEFEAIEKIFLFIQNEVASSREKVALIGFNSSRFDLGYLRTTFIRNGANPYFGGRLVYRDLLHVARKLSISHPKLPRAAKKGEERLSLSLENLCHQLGLLNGAQTHHSRDDVLLSIELAKTFRDSFDLNVLRYEAYEAGAFENNGGRGSVCLMRSPEYDLSKSTVSEDVPVVLLDFGFRSSLWVQLKRYEAGEGRKSIQWINKNGGSFFYSALPEENETLKEISLRALKEFKGITVDNFFQISSCDIEQDIYRLDMQRIGELGKAIQTGMGATLKDKDSKVLYLRYLLRDQTWAEDERMLKMLKAYATYRYGGKALLSKGGEDSEKVFHETLKHRLELIGQLIKDRQSAEDKELMRALDSFYRSSLIYRACSEELLACLDSVSSEVM